MRVVAGEHSLNQVSGNEQTRSVSAVYIHPNYNPSNSDNDIALLKVNLIQLDRSMLNETIDWLNS